MPKVRLGVALLVPVPEAGEIDGLRRALGDGALDRIAAHCTLVPPVNVRGDRVDDSVALLRRAAAATRPFRATLGPPAAFWPVTPVLHLPVTDDGGALAALRQRVFVEPLARSLTHPFVPHVTLAEELAPERLEHAVALLAGWVREVSFDGVHLLRQGDGRTWEPIGHASFGPPSVVGRGGLPLELDVADRLAPEAARFAAQEWTRWHAEQDATTERSDLALTARREGRVVGVATGRTQGTAAHLSELLVAAGERGTGVGSHLLALFVSEVAARGVEQVTVRTERDAASQRFYEQRGWRVDVVLPGSAGGRDAVHLRRLLGGAA